MAITSTLHSLFLSFHRLLLNLVFALRRRVYSSTNALLSSHTHAHDATLYTPEGVSNRTHSYNTGCPLVTISMTWHHHSQERYFGVDDVDSAATVGRKIYIYIQLQYERE